MKTLIVYFSLEGNTHWAVEQVAARLHADTLKLVPEKPYPSSGFPKYFWGGKSAVFGDAPELQPYSRNIAQYERIILATPIWAGTFAPPLRTYLNHVQVSSKHLALLACSGGGSAEKAFTQLKTLAGASGDVPTCLLVSPKDKPSKANEAALNAFYKALGD